MVLRGSLLVATRSSSRIDQTRRSLLTPNHIVAALATLRHTPNQLLRPIATPLHHLGLARACQQQAKAKRG